MLPHERTIDTFEGQAKEVDDAIKKDKDDGASTSEPSKAKYVGWNVSTIIPVSQTSVSC